MLHFPGRPANAGVTLWDHSLATGENRWKTKKGIIPLIRLRSLAYVSHPETREACAKSVATSILKLRGLSWNASVAIPGVLAQNDTPVSTSALAVQSKMQTVLNHI